MLFYFLMLVYVFCIIFMVLYCSSILLFLINMEFLGVLLILSFMSMDLKEGSLGLLILMLMIVSEGILGLIILTIKVNYSGEDAFTLHNV